MNTKREAAKEILCQVSDLHAIISMCGIPEANSKLADIREKAASIFEGSHSLEKIMAGYEREVAGSIFMMSERINDLGRGQLKLNSVDLLQLVRIAEVFISNARVCMDRRARYGTVVGKIPALRSLKDMSQAA